jgi:hypothetical protein
MLNVGALGCAKIVANLETSAKEADVLSVEAHAQKLGDNIKELLKAVSTVLDHPAYQPHNKAPTAPFLQNS